MSMVGPYLQLPKTLDLAIFVTADCFTMRAGFQHYELARIGRWCEYYAMGVALLTWQVVVEEVSVAS